MEQRWISENLSDLGQIAKEVLDFSKNEKILLFVGKMGAGKTTFIKELCNTLGVLDEVSSPTFSLVNEYKTASDQTLYHFDFYRIEHQDEAHDIGFEEYLNSGNLCFIEWPDRIDGLIPNSFL